MSDPSPCNCDQALALLASLKSMMLVYESLKAGEQEWRHYEQDYQDALKALPAPATTKE